MHKNRNITLFYQVVQSSMFKGLKFKNKKTEEERRNIPYIIIKAMQHIL